jgi:hypothetical protein
MHGAQRSNAEAAVRAKHRFVSSLGEEGEHRRPRARVRFRLVGAARLLCRVDARDAEAVERAAINVELPVGARFGHLALEGGAVLGRAEGIVGTGAGEDLGADRAGFGGDARGEVAVEADDGADVGAAPRELERGEAAEAVTDRDDSARVDARLIHEDGERGREARTEGEAIFDEALDDAHPVRAIGEALSEEVGREDGEPELGEPAAPLSLVFAEAAPAVEQEDRSAARRVRRQQEAGVLTAIDRKRDLVRHAHLPVRVRGSNYHQKCLKIKAN